MVRVTGPHIRLILNGFNWVWTCASSIRKAPFKQDLNKSLVCHTLSWRNKRRVRKFRLQILNEAKKSIKIVNPYFVPPYHFLKALISARKRGVDVQLLTTEINDIFFRQMVLTKLLQNSA